jgi:hypothetical protein
VNAGEDAGGRRLDRIGSHEFRILFPKGLTLQGDIEYTAEKE